MSLRHPTEHAHLQAPPEQAPRSVLLIGASGQLGRELQLTAPPTVTLQPLERDAIDLSRPATIATTLASYRYQLLINAAAYTAVDRAEQEPALAYAINADAAGELARCSAAAGAMMIQISTDFVFAGDAATPRPPEAATAPLSIYGASKRAGEVRVLAAHRQALVLRTSWLYSRHRNNFVKTMLRLLAERDQIGVVADQIGTPTWARTLAQAVWRAANTNLQGLHHWSDSGVASWYDLAQAVAEEGSAVGLLPRPALIHPITTAEYPTPAQRPPYSVLACDATRQALQFEPPHWRVALRQMLADLCANNET